LGLLFCCERTTTTTTTTTMRHGRAKAARRTLQFFHRTQGIHPPYQLLLDGTFIVAVMKYNLPLMERLDRLLQHAAVHLFMTRSSITELEKLKEHAAKDTDMSNKLILEQVHQWATRQCHNIITDADIPKRQDCVSSIKESVWEKFSTAGQDLLCLVASASEQGKQKYFVASQDETLLDVVRNLGSVPVIRLQRGSVLLLETPSKVASQQDSREERQKWSTKGSVTEQEKKLVDCVKEQAKRERRKESDTAAAGAAAGSSNGRRKQKAKGPNPLSAKKKRTTSSNAAPAKKRQRTKK
jgi:U3 small nucleolar RNA-associated protein 23